MSIIICLFGIFGRFAGIQICCCFSFYTFLPNKPIVDGWNSLEISIDEMGTPLHETHYLETVMTESKEKFQINSHKLWLVGEIKSLPRLNVQNEIVGSHHRRAQAERSNDFMKKQQQKTDPNTFQSD